MTRPVRDTPRFRRELRRWLKGHPQDGAAVEGVVDQLAADAFAPALHTHKLHGPLAGRWACSVRYDCRIVFALVAEADGSETVVVPTIGTHADVYWPPSP